MDAPRPRKGDPVDVQGQGESAPAKPDEAAESRNRSALCDSRCQAYGITDQTLAYGLNRTLAFRLMGEAIRRL